MLDLEVQADGTSSRDPLASFYMGTPWPRMDVMPWEEWAAAAERSVQESETGSDEMNIAGQWDCEGCWVSVGGFVFALAPCHCDRPLRC